MFRNKVFNVILIIGCIAFISLMIPTNADEPNEVGANNFLKQVRAKRWVCNDITGDFLCAGWPGSWRCTCGAACYGGVCTCKRCI
jgi:hypothetical protein